MFGIIKKKYYNFKYNYLNKYINKYKNKIFEKFINYILHKHLFSNTPYAPEPYFIMQNPFGDKFNYGCMNPVLTTSMIIARNFPTGMNFTEIYGISFKVNEKNKSMNIDITLAAPGKLIGEHGNMINKITKEISDELGVPVEINLHELNYFKIVNY